MREYVTSERLVEILNDRLSRSPDCSRCQFTASVHRYQEPDDSGCNWSPDLILSGQGVELCQPDAAEVIAWARPRYNLLSREGTVDDLDLETRGQRFRCRVESPGTVTTFPGGPLAVPQNAGWWVKVDGAGAVRAFDASPDDTDASLLRRRILDWHASRGELS